MEDPSADGPRRNSDVDFRDVFGGPPRRRTSFYETRHRSRPDSLDSHPASSSGEKTAFGDCSSPARRRDLGNDFFSDIFPGSDSSCSSPRKMDRDPSSLSSHGSWTLSPARSGPPPSESITGGSSLLSQLSLSMKWAKGIDYPTLSSPMQRSLYKKDVGSPDGFGFSSSLNTSMPTSTIPAPPLNDDMRNDVHAFYRQSPLSDQISHGLNKPLKATVPSSLSMEAQSNGNATTLEGYVRSGQFHFSIYKWSGKGVTLAMPSNKKETNESRLRRLPEVVIQGVGLSSCNDDVPTTPTDSKSESENQDSKFLKDHIMDKTDDSKFGVVEELPPAGADYKFIDSDLTESDAYTAKGEKIPVIVNEARKPELKNHRGLFVNALKKQVRQVEEMERISRGRKNVNDDTNANQQARREKSMNQVEVSSPSVQDAQVSLEDKVRGNRAKGKVKDFIKIFNHDASPKRKGLFDIQNRRSRGRDGVKDKIEDQVSASASKRVEEMEPSSRSCNEQLLDSPTVINQILKATEIPANFTCSEVHKISDSSSERNCISGPSADSTPEIINTSMCDIGESQFVDLESCLVEQLSQDPDQNMQSDSQQDLIKASDVKIREWSKGKDGNIRSLLSTLQYVLWPESGWKPVPLVDIIEGNSVKRAYQKAMLCLHPDKLQQKGASLHQKFIAEKVFGILQEAWDHFNSISSF